MGAKNPDSEITDQNTRRVEEAQFQGRYTLEAAANMLEEHAGVRAADMLNKLMRSTADGRLPVYEPGRRARYQSNTVREFYEESYWNDLNRWLDDNEPRIAWRFPMSESARNELELGAASREIAYNGAPIDWDYWVHQMPALTAAQAARLICGLDPDRFENLDNRPNENDPSQACAEAKRIQRLAETAGMEKVSPADWLQWADRHGFKVHACYRLEVDAIEATALPAAPQSAEEHDVSTRPLPQQRFQEQEILRVIRELGHDPCSLPKDKPGKPGVKAVVREKLNFTVTVFDKAWGRLRAAGEIKNVT